MARKSERGALNEAASYADAIYKDWQKVDSLDRIVERLDENDMIVLGLRFKVPDGDGASWLAIVTARSPEGDLVAFHDAPTFRECLIGTVNRLSNGSMKWKENKPWKGQ